MCSSEHSLTHAHPAFLAETPTVPTGTRRPDTQPPPGPHYPKEAESQRQKQSREAERMRDKSCADPEEHRWPGVSTPQPGQPQQPRPGSAAETVPKHTRMGKLKQQA